MSTPSNSPEPKIFVDDDWKARVQKEREETERPPASDPSRQGTSSAPDEIPPATFEFLVTTFYMQAMTALGLVADPVTKKAQPNPAWAKHIIDMLGVLEEKTRGNLSANESEMLTQVLHQLRLLFVSPPRPPESSKPKPTSLELPQRTD